MEANHAVNLVAVKDRRRHDGRSRFTVASGLLVLRWPSTGRQTACEFPERLHRSTPLGQVLPQDTVLLQRAQSAGRNFLDGPVRVILEAAAKLTNGLHVPG